MALAWCSTFSVCAPVNRGSATELYPFSRETVADVQCLVVGVRLTASANQAQSQGGSMLMLYFLGRIDGRSPHVDLEKLIERQAKDMTASDFANWSRRCGAEFSARGAQITQIGKSLQQSGN